jgi:hypothetical protein
LIVAMMASYERARSHERADSASVEIETIDI